MATKQIWEAQTMSKKEIKAALAEYGYKVIKPSWHHNKANQCILFNAYDDQGVCHMFYINYDTQYARRTMMTDTDLRLDPVDVGFMFWEVE